VVIGFSSQVSRDPAALTRAVVEAVGEAGVRAVVLTGFGGLRENLETTRDLAVVDAAPHDWLFARAAAAVHHGGSGSTGAALRAGLPGFAVPFGYDQPLWGDRLHALGVGPPPIPARVLTPGRLASALREVTTVAGMRARAEALGERIRREDGIGTAVGLLTRLAGG
jgi:sterol 3beta-glucosyltransferase